VNIISNDGVPVKIMTINVNSLKSSIKRSSLRDLCFNEECDIMSIQETKINSDFCDGELQLKGFDIAEAVDCC
jgi:exonuclease III